MKDPGSLGAMMVISLIGNFDDFQHPEQLVAYFGTVPTVRHSKEWKRSGRMTEHGTKLGRTVLGKCVLIAMQYIAYIANLYHKIRSRPKTGKAIMALAKNILDIIYYHLKNNSTFEKFFQLGACAKKRKLPQETLFLGGAP